MISASARPTVAVTAARPIPSGELSYGQIADDIAALITALELDRPVVGGYSDGGQVALEIGARHPEAAGGLIIGAAYPDFVTTACASSCERISAPTTAARPTLPR